MVADPATDARVEEVVVRMGPGAFVPFATAVVLVASPSASAGESQLALRIRADNDCQSCLMFQDCAQAIQVVVSVWNLDDTPVAEGSTFLAESLSVEISDSEGTVVAWWGGEDDGVPGEPRVWQPGESDFRTLVWPMVVGPLSEELPSPTEPPRPPVPFDGYRVEAVWRGLDGVELNRTSTTVEWMPGRLGDWPLYDSHVRFAPPTVPASRRATVLGQGRCGSVGVCSGVSERWAEVGVDGVVRVYAEAYCGPFAAPSRFLFAMRLPHLEVGDHLVEVYHVIDDEGGPYFQLEASATLTVMPDPLDRRGLAATE